MLPSPNSGWIVAVIVLIVFVVLYPLVLAVIARRKLHVSWRYFGFGALIFFLFQLISRVPIVTILGQALAPQLRSSQVLTWLWLFALAATAALFEEVGRYIGYRWLMGREEKTWSKAVMYGLGHGGLESMLLVGGLALLSLINILMLSTVPSGSLSAAQHAQAVQAITAINAQPAWLSLLGMWERLWTVPVQVALSVMVLQVLRRGKMSWLWLAMLGHFIVDFTSVGLVQILGASVTTSLIVEGVVGVFGLLALWIIWSLRDQPEHLSDMGSVPIAPDVAL